ncbi:uncharacterized protein METZ01_LOCUS275231, partial [marine metagenome]
MYTYAPNADDFCCEWTGLENYRGKYFGILNVTTSSELNSSELLFGGKVGDDFAYMTTDLSAYNLEFTPVTGSRANYNVYADQVTLAGQVFKDADFAAFTDSNKKVMTFAAIPIENFSATSSVNDYFYPNFIPASFWSSATLGPDYSDAMDLPPYLAEYWVADKPGFSPYVYYDKTTNDTFPFFSTAPHAVSISLKTPALATNKTIWTGEGDGGYDLSLKTNSNGYLEFKYWEGSHNKGWVFTATNHQLAANTDYGIYWEYDGGGCGTNCDAAARFNIKMVDPSNGAVSTVAGNYVYTQHNNLGTVMTT